jgi:ketosteroid isomerase-like protein
MAEMARRFVEALGRLEQDSDLSPMLALFARDCEVGTVAVLKEGRQGVAEFWSHYRATFSHMRSSFRNIVEAGGRIALEWETRGAAADGTPLHYEGMSILEVDGDAIQRFHAYFDPREIARQLAPPSKAGPTLAVPRSQAGQPAHATPKHATPR